jgi:UDP-hydrolysing UDP-N-acetyl-D-glucosamine 2-epimerase
MKNVTWILMTLWALAGALGAQAEKQPPPPGGPARDFRLPEKRTFTLDNGLAVTLVPFGTLPKAAVGVVVRTGNIDEKVRHAVTKLADYHLVATQKAAERVVRMGENPEAVFVTGCPSIDIAARVLAEPSLHVNPFEKYGGVGAQVDLGTGYLVVMQHPVTSEYELARRHVTETLHAIRDLGLPTLWFWPNVDAGSDGTSKGIRAFRELEQPTNIHFFKDIPPEDFLHLVKNSRAIVGNSSVAIRECSFLGVPAVNIGSRETGRERGPNVRDVGYERGEIMGAIRAILSGPRPEGVPLYGDGRAGERIAGVLAAAPLKFTKQLTY